ncbi:LANO_0C06700g1_1 [Lachancea nothofagi CBS 11611]|uniref:LANO_0C06700g1_1 n=1 Tax=Lachancea nothofagi CBS 11611 TaxID=1266666 RepID=A0A1G4J8B7_9SACH|nr:LANO_0C06700g1_1 [Lachancea nothofagi CBS 11611]
MKHYNVTYVEVLRDGEVIAKYYKSPASGYGSMGKAGQIASPQIFERLTAELVIPKVVPLEGNKVTKVSSSLLDGFDCYYGTDTGNAVYVCFSPVDVPKILPLRVLTELKPLSNKSDRELDSNVQTIVQQFHEELLSYHDSSTAEATEQDLQDIIQLMNDNIDKFLQRQERVSLLVDRTSKLNQSSYNFKRKAVRIKTKMWWQNVKLCSTLIAVSVIVLVVIFGAVHYIA